MSRIVALIPLRGGSKRIPYKNIKEIGGKPLAYWVCRAARESHCIDEVFVSTEDTRIRNVVQSLGLDVRIIERPVELAGDQTTTDEVIFDFMGRVAFDVLVTLQATSPLVSAHDIDSAIENFSCGSYDSLLTGVITNRFYWTLNGQPLNYDIHHRPFSQDFSGSVMENGAFYVTKRAVLERYRNRLGGKIGIHVMSPDTALELDNPEDWREIETLLVGSDVSIRERIGRVKIIISDFDGVWTDNTVCIDVCGRESVTCSKEDSLGLSLFRERSATPLLVISKERNTIVRHRCEKLGIQLLDSVDDKCAQATRALEQQHLSWFEACYIGNDVNDLECIQRAGLSFCPADARPEVKSHVHYILSHAGGHGAVREMLDVLASYQPSVEGVPIRYGLASVPHCPD